MNNEIVSVEAMRSWANGSLHRSGLGGFTELRAPSSTISQAFASASLARSLAGSLPELSGGASLASISERLDAFDKITNDITKPLGLRLASRALGLEPGWPAAKPGSQLFGVRKLESDILPRELRSSLVPRVKHLGPSQKTLAEIFGAYSTVTVRNAATIFNDHWKAAMARQADMFGTTMRNALNRMMTPTFDAIGRHVSAINKVVFESVDWEAIERAVRVHEARRPRTKIGFAALEAYDAFYLGHYWIADRFLAEHLGMKPNEDRRQALWQVLKSAFEHCTTEPKTWLLLDDDQAVAYLRVSVRNEAWRIRRDREMEDRIWWPEGEEEEDEEGVKLSKPVLRADHTLDFLIRKSPSPENILFPSPDQRKQVLEMLYLEGTEQDKKIVEMLMVGLDLPAIAAVLGWPEVQRFQRKARRWIRIKL